MSTEPNREQARAERLDQIWDATRPVEPAGGFDAVWARVQQVLADPQHTLAISDARRLRRRWLLAAAGLAQAAVLLVAALVLFHRTDGGPNAGPGAGTVAALTNDSVPRADIHTGGGAPAVPGAGLAVAPRNDSFARVDIAWGQPVVIRVSDHQVRQVKDINLSSLESRTNDVAADFDMLNAMESLAL